MDVASLSFACVGMFKEVFLLSRAVYRLIQSIKHATSESMDLHVAFHHQILYTSDFGQRFLSVPEVRDSLGVYDLTKLRNVFSEYTKLAEEQDADYKMWCDTSTMLDKPTTFPILKIEAPLNPSTYTTYNHVAAYLRDKLSRTTSSIRWSLFERRKLQHILHDFQYWNDCLKQLTLLGPLTAAVASMRPVHNGPGPTSLSQLSQEPDMKRMGLNSHILIRRSILYPKTESNNADLELKDFIISAQPEESRSLIMARLYKPTAPASIMNAGDVLVEYKDYSSTTIHEKGEEPVRQLAALLHLSNSPEQRTLPFKGYIRKGLSSNDENEQSNEQRQRYIFVFSFPPNMMRQDPTSLHSLLSSNNAALLVTLPLRFQIAKTISIAVGSLHTDGWLHKSLRSHNIVFLKSTTSSTLLLGKPYLVNFEYARHETQTTEFAYDSDFEKNLYRHPDGQGQPTIRFKKAHDMYALGLILLEIGLWRNLKSIWQEAVNQVTSETGQTPQGNRHVIKDYFMDATKKVAHAIGPAYAKAVMFCLTAADREDIEEDKEMSFLRNIVQQVDVQRLTNSGEFDVTYYVPHQQA